MRTIVITGGTDGMGAALARHYLRAGDHVVVIGRSKAKFDALLADGGSAEFLAADLSLADLLRAAERPVVVNTAVPGARADAIDFADLELSRGFTFRRANAQQRRANELLGILATARHPGLAYVTWGPARLVRSSFAGEVGLAMRVAAAVLGPLVGQRPDDAVRPVVEVIDNPVPGRSARRGAREVPLVVGPDDDRDAARLGNS